jgi:hypothetical protein
MFVDMYEVHRGCTDLLLCDLTWDFEYVKENRNKAIAHKDSSTVAYWLSGLYGRGVARITLEFGLSRVNPVVYAEIKTSLHK